MIVSLDTFEMIFSMFLCPSSSVSPFIELLTILRYKLFFLDSESVQSGYFSLQFLICLIFSLAITLIAFVKMGFESDSLVHSLLSLI